MRTRTADVVERLESGRLLATSVIDLAVVCTAGAVSELDGETKLRARVQQSINVASQIKDASNNFAAVATFGSFMADIPIPGDANVVAESTSTTC